MYSVQIIFPDKKNHGYPDTQIDYDHLHGKMYANINMQLVTEV
jgi:hypothetical protein